MVRHDTVIGAAPTSSKIFRRISFAVMGHLMTQYPFIGSESAVLLA